MAPWLDVREDVGETIFRVHQWPVQRRHFYICSSTCAEMEQAASDTDWQGQDGASIARRLADKGNGRKTGKVKGRVLYYFARAPLGGGHYRTDAAALLHMPKKNPLQIYGFCFRAGLHSRDELEAVTWLVNCTFKLAIRTNHAGGCLEWRLERDQDPGEICQLFRFTETRRDRYGSWIVKRCPR